MLVFCTVLRYFVLMHLHFHPLMNGSQDFLNVLVLGCNKSGIENIEKLSFYFMDLGPKNKLKIESVTSYVCIYVKSKYLVV